MKKYLLLILFFPLIVNAQGPHEARKKIDELEKIKLLDILKMDDQTAIKFFNRRNDFKDKMHDLEDQRESKMEQLNKAIDDKDNDQDLKKLVNDINNIDDNFIKTRRDYINSLPDILNYTQIAKVLTFENNFRKEIRDIIFKSRREGHR